MKAMEKSTFTPEYALLRTELVAIRTKARLTQRALAKRLRVPHSWVAKVESGERRIDFIELYWLFSACGAEPLPVLKRLLKSLSGVKRPTEQE